MPNRLEFYFDYASPYAYLAHMRLPEMLRRTGAAVDYRIVLLGGVFHATGNVSPIENKLKAPNGARDLQRFINRYRVPFRDNPHFPVNTMKLLRGAIVAEAEGFLERYSDIAFAAMWREGRLLSDDQVLAETLRAGGLDDRHILARIGEQEVKDKLKAYTEAAAKRGVFGVPTFFVGDEMFFGQDRLDFVEEALLGRSYLNAG